VPSQTAHDANRTELTTVLLDVNGTLTDPSAIGDVWGRPELGDRVLEHAVHTAMVAALLGQGERPFSDHLRAAVDVVVAESSLDPGLADDAMRAAAALPARDGAAVALAALREAGLRLVALTNSGAEAGEATLRGCGLAESVDRVLGVDAVATFKPDPAVYAHALATLRVDARETALLATHPWDLAGAAHAGIRTAWVRHGERVWPSVFASATVTGDRLRDIAESLAGLGSSAD
jgi:2-haloacid dehalogenase